MKGLAYKINPALFEKRRWIKKSPVFQGRDMLGLHWSMDKVDRLVYDSKMSAKVDSSALQDGFQIYTHNLIFTKDGRWNVIQQGMHTEIQKARRYHWLSFNVKDFVEEPHTGIISDVHGNPLNLTAKQSKSNREISVGIIREEAKKIIKDFRKILDRQNSLTKQKRFENLAPYHSAESGTVRGL